MKAMPLSLMIVPEIGSAESGLTKMSVFFFGEVTNSRVESASSLKSPLGNAVRIRRQCVQLQRLQSHKANLLLGQNISFIEHLR